MELKIKTDNTHNQLACWYPKPQFCGVYIREACVKFFKHSNKV